MAAAAATFAEEDAAAEALLVGRSVDVCAPVRDNELVLLEAL